MNNHLRNFKIYTFLYFLLLTPLMADEFASIDRLALAQQEGLIASKYLSKQEAVDRGIIAELNEVYTSVRIKLFSTLDPIKRSGVMTELNESPNPKYLHKYQTCPDLFEPELGYVVLVILYMKSLYVEQTGVMVLPTYEEFSALPENIQYAQKVVAQIQTAWQELIGLGKDVKALAGNKSPLKPSSSQKDFDQSLYKAYEQITCQAQQNVSVIVNNMLTEDKTKKYATIESYISKNWHQANLDSVYTYVFFEIWCQVRSALNNLEKTTVSAHVGKHFASWHKTLYERIYRDICLSQYDNIESLLNQYFVLLQYLITQDERFKLLGKSNLRDNLELIDMLNNDQVKTVITNADDLMSFLKLKNQSFLGIESLGLFIDKWKKDILVKLHPFVQIYSKCRWMNRPHVAEQDKYTQIWSCFPVLSFLEINTEKGIAQARIEKVLIDVQENWTVDTIKMLELEAWVKELICKHEILWNNIIVEMDDKAHIKTQWCAFKQFYCQHYNVLLHSVVQSKQSDLELSVNKLVAHICFLLTLQTYGCTAGKDQREKKDLLKKLTPYLQPDVFMTYINICTGDLSSTKVLSKFKAAALMLKKQYGFTWPDASLDTNVIAREFCLEDLKSKFVDMLTNFQHLMNHIDPSVNIRELPGMESIYLILEKLEAAISISQEIKAIMSVIKAEWQEFAIA